MEQITYVAKRVKEAGAGLLRGGAFKPRTSPYAFQGLHAKGIDLLLEAKRETGLPIVTEIMDVATLPLFEDVDVIQVGARNMQNFELLKELGMTKKPILLKRGLANTIQELLMSAEYIMAGGNPNVILCERGIRTFETATRNTLDLSAVPVLHSLTHLPVVVDPSHATGVASLVRPMALAAVAAGADGLMIRGAQRPGPCQVRRRAVAEPRLREVAVRRARGGRMWGGGSMNIAVVAGTHRRLHGQGHQARHAPHGAGRGQKRTALLKAELLGAIDARLTDETLATCDLVIVALYPPRHSGLHTLPRPPLPPRRAGGGLRRRQALRVRSALWRAGP